MALLGLISDTHGFLDPRVHQAFEGVDRILHAGDVCRAEVLHELAAIAPVTAVAGNCDRFDPAAGPLPPLYKATIEGHSIVMLHDRGDLGPVPHGTDVVIFGHSHLPMATEIDGVLWVNPGSSTQPRRSPLGKSVALLSVTSGGVSASIVALSDLTDDVK